MTTSRRIKGLRALIVACGAVAWVGCARGGSVHEPAAPPENAGPKPVDVEPGIGELDPNYRPRNLSEKVFTRGGAIHRPIDMTAQSLSIEFDVARREARGTSRILFSQRTASRPIFLLDATITEIRVNGREVSFTRIGDPYGANQYVSPNVTLPVSDGNVLEVDYELHSARVTFVSGGVRFLSTMADTLAQFFERYGPAGFEDDRFAMDLHLKITGASRTHGLFANGSTEQLGASEWRIRFPSHYSSSSFFVHLSEADFEVRRFTVKGKAAEIPVTVYAASAAVADRQTRSIPNLVREMEAAFGPYPHPFFIAYLGKSSGGMEYVASTITSERSLAHELFHQWFGRGMMPAEGRAGWIDEAIASWRDYGYTRAKTLLKRAPTELGTSSAYDRKTPTNSYADGRALMAELDAFFAGRGGLRPLLAQVVQRYRLSLTTTEEFRLYLQTLTGTDLMPFFRRYVYGNAVAKVASEASVVVDDPQDAPILAPQPESADEHPWDDTLHPPPLTDEEAAELR